MIVFAKHAVKVAHPELFIWIAAFAFAFAFVALIALIAMDFELKVLKKEINELKGR